MEKLLRIIVYGILYVITLVTYIFLHSHFHFIVLVLMTLAPVFSILVCYITSHNLVVTVENMAGKNYYGKQGEEAYVNVKLSNPTPFPALDVKINFIVRNTFFKTEGKRTMSVPLHAFKGYDLELPLIATLPGIVEVEVTKVHVKDMLGFVHFHKKVAAKNEVIILPADINNLNYDLVNIDQGMLESEESTKKGNDFSDVQEIREYIPGDKLMSIHWKLSAKRDILMVKDRVSMSDKQLVILPELCGRDIVNLEIVLVTTYSIIKQLISDKTTVRLMYWSKKRYEYEDVRIDYMEEANQAFAKMFYEETYDDMEEAASYMANVNPHMKAYLHITAENHKACIRVRENS